MLPVPTQPRVTLSGWLTAPNAWLNDTMVIVFLCAKTLRRIPYDGGAGLEFKVPKQWCAQTVGAATQFWSDFGPVIKLAAFAVTAAVTATTGVRLSELVPAGLSRSVAMTWYMRTSPLHN